MNSKITSLQKISLLLIACMVLFGCKGKNGSTGSQDSAAFVKAAAPPQSKPVPSTDADTKINDYKGAVQNLIPTFDASGNKVSLYGFKFDYGQINEIINNNASGVSSVDQVAIYFAFEQNLKRWHMIAYGMNGPYPTTGVGGTLLDYAKPGSGRSPSIFEDNTSTAIPTDGAATLRSYYTDHTVNTPLSTYDNKGTYRELDGFAFTASQINQILGENPDKVAFDIGLEYMDAGKTKIRWHIVAYGMKKGSPIGTSTAAPAVLPTDGLYYDKADPCPPCNP